MRTVLRNGRLILPDRSIFGGSLLLENDIIAAVLPQTENIAADRVYDAHGCFVSPGFVDLHVHGGGGFDFLDGTVEAVIGSAKTHLLHGTTTLIPTALSAPLPELYRFLECFREARSTKQVLPNMPGVHLEGPFVNPQQAGALNPAFLLPPTQEHIDAILALCDDVKLVTLAPELPNALTLIDRLVARGIRVSAGHSQASYAQMEQAMQHGVRHVTHLYSAMSSLHRINAHRVLGLLESAYAFDALSVEIIADGCHLPAELLRLIVKCKPHEQICLVTDAMRGAGLPEGQTVLLGSTAHGVPVLLEQGVAIMPDRSCFAGSICTAHRCIRTMNKHTALSLPEIIEMMSIHPARVLGMEQEIGSLAIGKRADLCLLNSDISLLGVFVGGEAVKETFAQPIFKDSFI